MISSIAAWLPFKKQRPGFSPERYTPGKEKEKHLYMQTTIFAGVPCRIFRGFLKPGGTQKMSTKMGQQKVLTFRRCHLLLKDEGFQLPFTEGNQLILLMEENPAPPGMHKTL